MTIVIFLYRMEKSVNFLSIVAKIKWSPSTSRKSTKILANRPFWLKIWIRSRGKNYTFLNPVNSWNSTLDFNGNSTGILRIRKKEKKPKNLLLFLKWFIYDGGEASQLILWVKFHQIFQSLPVFVYLSVWKLHQMGSGWP